MRKSLIFALIFMFCVIFYMSLYGAEEDSTFMALTGDYEVEDIYDVEIEITTPYKSTVKIGEIEYAISRLLSQITLYNTAISETIEEVEKLKILRNQVKEEAEKVMFINGLEM